MRIVTGTRVWLSLVALTLSAQRLPLRSYTTEDGLPSSYIHKIVPDSRGFLWFCTRDGLSRFDGTRFVTYSTRDGLPVPQINHLLETRQGEYWVATNGGGVSRFDPTARQADLRRALFTTVRAGDTPLSNRVNRLYQDRRGRIWAATDDGLFRMRESGASAAFDRFPLPAAKQTSVTSFAEDRDGNLWVGTYAGLVKIAGGDRYVEQSYGNRSRVLALLYDREERLWAGYESEGLLTISSDGTTRRFTPRDGSPGERIAALLETPDGHVWAAGEGLAEFDGRNFRIYGKDQGIGLIRRGGLSQDRDGNLWLTTIAGALKFAREGMVAYGKSDGLPERIHSVFEAADGALLAAGVDLNDHVSLHRMDGGTFRSIGPDLPPAAKVTWPGQGALYDHSGNLWLLTRTGLWRFDTGRSTRPVVYDRQTGLVRDAVSALYEDRRGDLWIGSETETDAGLTHWDRTANRFQAYTVNDGLPAGKASAFAEDRDGRIWIGFEYGGVVRYNGQRFERVAAAERLDGTITAIHRDRAGGIWAASSQSGVLRVDDGSPAGQRFRRYDTGTGLASNYVRCVTEDLHGRLYIGTARGIDRVDPQTAAIRHYGAGDGLPSDFLNTAYRDHTGAIWFGTYNGLARLEPRPDVPARPPDVWIESVRVAGEPRPLSETGERKLPAMRLASSANNVQFDFFTVNLRAGESLRYQFLLEGADRTWSALTDQRTARFSNLAPGSYRFRVRSVTADGIVSEEAAEAPFEILAPVWRRWWFVTGAFAVTLAGLYWLHRFRVEQLIAVERLRRRIAADLHDDIGASLSRVAILSEVVKRQVGAEHAEPNRRLSEIADTARTLVASMSDIVWSVDPRLDDVENVVLRVRQLAADVLASQAIAWEFETPERPERLKLHPDQRRHLYLIFKEALTNVARHSSSRTVRMTLRAGDGQLRAEIRDDGRGFDPHRVKGRGLENMKARAAQAGGGIRVDSAAGAGTQIILEIPLKRFGA